MAPNKSEIFADKIIPVCTVKAEVVESEQLVRGQGQVILQHQGSKHIPIAHDELDGAQKSKNSNYNFSSASEASMAFQSTSFIKDESVVTNEHKEQVETVESHQRDTGSIADIKMELEADQSYAKVSEDEEGVLDDIIDDILEFNDYEEEVPPVSPPIITLNDDDIDADDSEDDESALKVSTFLYEGMDPDDELYIAYLARPNATKTLMCVICYEWFESTAELDHHLKSVHQDNMKLYGCKRCGKKFWSRFLRQRHEKLHRFDIKGPIGRYIPKNRPFDCFESKHYLKRLRPAPFTAQYRDLMKELDAQIKSTDFDCIQCDKCFQSEEEQREHYEEEHALQTCVHCGKQIGNSKELRKHEKDVHGLHSVNENYPGGAWKLWDSWKCEEMKKEAD